MSEDLIFNKLPKVQNVNKQKVLHKYKKFT